MCDRYRWFSALPSHLGPRKGVKVYNTIMIRTSCYMSVDTSQGGIRARVSGTTLTRRVRLNSPMLVSILADARQVFSSHSSPSLLLVLLLFAGGGATIASQIQRYEMSVYAYICPYYDSQQLRLPRDSCKGPPSNARTRRYLSF